MDGSGVGDGSGARIAELEARLARLERTRPTSDVAIVWLRHGTYDAFFYALSLAVAAGALGSDTKIFVSQWAIAGLRASSPPRRPKSFLHRLFSWMLPANAERLPLTHLHVLGLGQRMMRGAIASAGAGGVEELL